MSLKGKLKIKQFLQKHQLAVVATSHPINATPESALVAFVEDENLCLYFQTGKYTRKVHNLKHNPHVSAVIGLTLEDMATMQYEGKAELLKGKAAIEDCKKLFLAKNSPTTAEYLDRPDAIFYKVTPTIIYFADYTKGTKPKITMLRKFKSK